MTPIELDYALKDHMESKQNEINIYNENYFALFKGLFESARMEAVFVINSQRKQGDQIQKFEDLIKFSWEKGESGKQSPEEMKNMLLGFAKTHNKHVKRRKQVKNLPPPKRLQKKGNKK